MIPYFNLRERYCSLLMGLKTPLLKRKMSVTKSEIEIELPVSFPFTSRLTHRRHSFCHVKPNFAGMSGGGLAVIVEARVLVEGDKTLEAG